MMIIEEEIKAERRWEGKRSVVEGIRDRGGREAKFSSLK